MDERLQRALDQANYNATLQNQRKNFRLKFENACLYSVNGGSFVVDPTLISYVGILMSRGEADAILIDSRSNPIEISDLAVFNDAITGVYQTAINEFKKNTDGLRRARTTKAAVGL